MCTHTACWAKWRNSQTKKKKKSNMLPSLSVARESFDLHLRNHSNPLCMCCEALSCIAYRRTKKKTIALYIFMRITWNTWRRKKKHEPFHIWKTSKFREKRDQQKKQRTFSTLSTRIRCTVSKWPFAWWPFVVVFYMFFRTYIKKHKPNCIYIVNTRFSCWKWKISNHISHGFREMAYAHTHMHKRE